MKTIFDRLYDNFISGGLGLGAGGKDVSVITSFRSLRITVPGNLFAPDWPDIYTTNLNLEFSSAQMTGISEPITLDIKCPFSFEGSRPFYRVESSPTQPVYTDLTGFTELKGNDLSNLVVVNPDDWVTFSGRGEKLYGGAVYTINVLNASDNNTLIDSLIVETAYIAPP